MAVKEELTLFRMYVPVSSSCCGFLIVRISSICALIKLDIKVGDGPAARIRARAWVIPRLGHHAKTLQPRQQRHESCMNLQSLDCYISYRASPCPTSAMPPNCVRQSVIVAGFWRNREHARREVLNQDMKSQ